MPVLLSQHLWPPSLSHLTRLTPSASQSATLRFIATAPTPPTRSLVVVLPVCLPLPLSQRLCLLLRPSVCWLLRGIVGPLHSLVVATGLPPSPITHASASRRRRQQEVVAESCHRQSRDQDLQLPSSWQSHRHHPTCREVGKLDGGGGRAPNPRLPSSLSLSPVTPSPSTSCQRCRPLRLTSLSATPLQLSSTSSSIVRHHRHHRIPLCHHHQRC